MAIENDTADHTRTLEQHVSELEKSLENARKERTEMLAQVAESNRLAEERLAERNATQADLDAALADNAALVDLLRDGRDSDEEDEAWADRALAAIDAPHPGTALLEKHREELAAAARRHETTRATMQVREEEHRKEVERLHRTIATLTGDAYKASLVRARNEGLEKAAAEFDREADSNPGMQWARTCRSLSGRIRALKEPEGGQS